ncbi:essential meiotic endonuclease 1-like protein 1 variant 3 [Sesbania bispinosa]|nr:essential meiotic endonuclease 1-like protein 1 variant 3 [Sesbania bispinosa]
MAPPREPLRRGCGGDLRLSNWNYDEQDGSDILESLMNEELKCLMNKAMVPLETMLYQICVVMRSSNGNTQIEGPDLG